MRLRCAFIAMWFSVGEGGEYSLRDATPGVGFPRFRDLHEKSSCQRRWSMAVAVIIGDCDHQETSPSFGSPRSRRVAGLLYRDPLTFAAGRHEQTRRHHRHRFGGHQRSSRDPALGCGQCTLAARSEHGARRGRGHGPGARCGLLPRLRIAYSLAGRDASVRCGRDRRWPQQPPWRDASGLAARQRPRCR